MNPGGVGLEVVHVTNLNDSGSGSLRDALSRGNRHVVFDVSGTIRLDNGITIDAPNLTIDGLSAPSPGITLTGRGIAITGENAENIIVEGIRFREISGDALSVGSKDRSGSASSLDELNYLDARNIMISHVSTYHATDGGIDVSHGASDVTIQWSIIGPHETHNLLTLMKYASRRITFHHNLWINGSGRMPQIAWCDGDCDAYSSYTVADVRNNVVWNWGSAGTLVGEHATANVANNYYWTSADAEKGIKSSIGGEPGRVYTTGNVSQNRVNLNDNGNWSEEFPVPGITETDACTAAYDVEARAGATGPNFGRDSVDQNLVGQLNITCDGQASGDGGSGSGDTVPAPTLSLSADPTSIVEGESSTLSWSSTDADSCEASGAWSGTKAVSGSKIVSPTADATYSLSCTGSGGTASDSVSISVSASSDDTTDGGDTTDTTTDGDTSFTGLLEVEEGSLSSPMEVRNGTNALGGAYVTPVSGFDSTSPNREISVSFSAPSSGTYYLWVRLYGPSAEGDALYVGIDSTWDRVFPANHDVWEWVPVDNGGGSAGFTLSEGSHVIQVGHGEIGARIDAVYVTTDSADVPTHTADGSGGASNQPDPPEFLIGVGEMTASGSIGLLEGQQPHDSRGWLAVSWGAYNDAKGETRPVTCDLDGDGRREVVIGLGSFPSNGGWLEIRDDSASDHVHLGWIRVSWPAYNSSNGETFPACGDLDGDGRDEIAVGLGSGGAGWFQLFDDAAASYASLGWRRVGWSAYNSSNGVVFPAIGNVDGDPAAELLLGLGSGSGGWIQILDDAAHGFAPLSGTPTAGGWFRVNWSSYNSSRGLTRPAVCDLNGDGTNEVVVGLGSGSSGWLEVLSGQEGGFAHVAWPQVAWSAYNSSNGETFPACGDLDGDGADELVLGLGSSGGGWLEVKDDLGAGLGHLSWPRVREGGSGIPGPTRPTVAR